MGTQREQVLALLRRHAGCLAGLARWKLAASAALLVAVGATEGLGLLLLVPLLRFAGLEMGAGSAGRLEEGIVGLLDTAGVPRTLGAVLALYVGVASIQVILGRYQAVFQIALEQDVVRSLRHRIYGNIFGASWTFLARERGTDLAHVLTRDLDRLGAATAQLASVGAAALVTAVYLAFALVLSPVITGLFLGSGALLLGALRGGAGPARAAGEEFSTASTTMYAVALEHLAGIRTVKGEGREGAAVAMFEEVTDRLAAAHVNAARAYSRSKALFDLGGIAVLGVALFVSVGTLQVATGTLLLLLFLFARIMPRLAALQQGVQQYLTLVTSVDAVTALQSRLAAAAEPRSRDDGGSMRLERGITFRSVGVRYGERETWALRGIDLTIAARKTTAVVGPSGAGKSTFADILLGLLAPNEGMIAVDDAPLEPGRLRAWRDRIGYVAQDTFLLHDTVRANLLWAVPDASDEEIARALRLSAADAFVAALPHGQHTVIGDRGVTLSGGERQRLALARALLRDPDLLILDEATSFLDSENERRIQKAIEGLHGSMTIVIIAHRLSTIRNADAIHVLDGGRIVESGTWESLLDRPAGRFRDLCAAQGVSHVPSPLESQRA